MRPCVLLREGGRERERERGRERVLCQDTIPIFEPGLKRVECYGLAQIEQTQARSE